MHSGSGKQIFSRTHPPVVIYTYTYTKAHTFSPPVAIWIICIRMSEEKYGLQHTFNWCCNTHYNSIVSIGRWRRITICNTLCNPHCNTHCNFPGMSEKSYGRRLWTRTWAATHTVTHTAAHCAAPTSTVQGCRKRLTTGCSGQERGLQRTLQYTLQHAHCNTHCSTHCNTHCSTHCCSHCDTYYNSTGMLEKHCDRPF